MTKLLDRNDGPRAWFCARARPPRRVGAHLVRLPRQRQTREVAKLDRVSFFAVTAHPSEAAMKLFEGQARVTLVSTLSKPVR